MAVKGRTLIYESIINEQLPQVATFKRMVLFRRAISEWNKHSHFFMFCQSSCYLVGAKDSRPPAGAGEPWKGVEDICLLPHPSPHTVPHVIPWGPGERSIDSLSLASVWIRHKTGEWIKLAVLNEEHKSSSVCLVTMWKLKKNEFLMLR